MVAYFDDAGIWFLCGDMNGEAACKPASLLPPKCNEPNNRSD